MLHQRIGRRELSRRREVFLENIKLLQDSSKSWGGTERKRADNTVENLMEQVYEIEIAIELIDRRK